MKSLQNRKLNYDRFSPHSSPLQTLQWANVGLMLGQRLQRWSNINLLFAGGVYMCHGSYCQRERLHWKCYRSTKWGVREYFFTSLSARWGNSVTEGSPKPGLCPTPITSRVIYGAQYYKQHCTLHAFEQFGVLYMHNHDDKYPPRTGFEPGTPRLQAPVDTYEPSGPANEMRRPHPASTRRWPNVGLMLGQHRERWPSIMLTLDQCLVFAGNKLSFWLFT